MRRFGQKRTHQPLGVDIPRRQTRVILGVEEDMRRGGGVDNIVTIRHHHHRRHQNQHHQHRKQGGEVVVVVVEVVDNIVTIHSRQLGVAAHLDGMSSPFSKEQNLF